MDIQYLAPIPLRVVMTRRILTILGEGSTIQGPGTGKTRLVYLELQMFPSSALKQILSLLFLFFLYLKTVKESHVGIWIEGNGKHT